MHANSFTSGVFWGFFKDSPSLLKDNFVGARKSEDGVWSSLTLLCPLHHCAAILHLFLLKVKYLNSSMPSFNFFFYLCTVRVQHIVNSSLSFILLGALRTSWSGGSVSIPNCGKFPTISTLNICAAVFPLSFPSTIPVINAILFKTLLESLDVLHLWPSETLHLSCSSDWELPPSMCCAHRSPTHAFCTGLVIFLNF